MDLRERVATLGRVGPASTPVVTVYLGTRWADEHQRARVRIFLKNELAQARRASTREPPRRTWTGSKRRARPCSTRP